MKATLLITFLLSLTACSSKPDIVTFHEKIWQGNNEIYVVNHGWHTGFVVPAEKIQERLPQLKTRFGATPFIEFGWGDKGFYQAQEITVGLALRALFWSSGSVIHAVALPIDAPHYFRASQIEKICLSDSAYASLLTFIANSFYKNQDGTILARNKGLYGDSQFYEGFGTYHLVNTCNKWTAKGLVSAGMDLSPVFKLTADSVMVYLQNQNKGCRI
jgi:uncharacterized protein (TIGR02117 family)